MTFSGKVYHSHNGCPSNNLSMHLFLVCNLPVRSGVSLVVYSSSKFHLNTMPMHSNSSHTYHIRVGTTAKVCTQWEVKFYYCLLLLYCTCDWVILMDNIINVWVWNSCYKALLQVKIQFEYYTIVCLVYEFSRVFISMDACVVLLHSLKMI